jgi:uncharacterized protein
MGTVRNSMASHPLVWFVPLAYALSWWSIPFADGGILPYGPFLAAVIILSLTKGRSGLKALFRRMVTWQGGLIWLLIAPGLVVGYLALAFMLNLLAGGEVSSVSHLTSFGPTVLTLIFLGGLWEEPGWTGFALPILQDKNLNHRFGFLRVNLTMGLVRAGWHLPLVISGSIAWYDAVFFSLAFQLLISWLFNKTGGSVFIPMLFHLTSNVVGGGIMLPLFAGADHDRYYMLLVICAWIFAALLNRPRRRSRGRIETVA